MTESLKTVQVDNDAEVQLLNFLMVNKKNLENIVGAQLSSLSLSYTDDAGYKVEYQKRETAV